MTHTEYSAELCVLNTVMFPYHLYDDVPFFNSFELREEWFNTPFHKLVAKQINHNKALNLPFEEEYIASELSKNGVMDENGWIKIISSTASGKQLFNTYINMLEKSKTNLQGLI